MYRVLNCIETQHDAWLVALAGAVCLLTCLAAVNLFQRARVAEEAAGLIWVATAGAVTGCGVWATHFIAILAYTPGLPIRYDMPTTVSSLLVAIVMTASGFGTALYNDRQRTSIVGGLLVAIGIATMHFMGMASLRIPAVIIWAPELVMASILLGAVFATSALILATRSETNLASASAAALLALAITSHHFVAMGAVTMIPNPAAQLDGRLLSPIALALAIAAVTVILVVGGLIGAMYDRRSRYQIKLRNLQLDAALNNMSQGLCMFGPDGRLQLCNDSYLRMYRLSPEVISAGSTVEEMFEARVAAGTIFKRPDQYRSRLIDLIAKRIPSNGINELVDGRTVSVTYQPMENGGWLATHEDITERKQAEARIEYLAQHDPVTGLPNRAAFNARLRQALQEAGASKATFAVIRIDIDRFKDINDTFGQSCGDILLSRLAEKFRAALGDDFLARPGGDEFTAISSLGSGAGALEGVCTRLSALLDNSFEIDGAAIRIGCSAGIGIYPQDGLDAEKLIAHADAALYRAKAEGRGVIRFFETTMDQQIRDRRLLHRDLAMAIERNELELHFQPQATTDGAIFGFEALVRWHHPQRGTVSPGVFIPLAEETGLIGAIDQWVLREACHTAAIWAKPLSIAVNLSPINFRRDDISSTILSVLIETGLSAKRLEIEITEGVLIGDFARAISLLGRIKNLGVRVAMDDFGTGYSSLSYLQSFPFDKIKIDQTFVGKLGTNTQSTAIVHAILGLGQALKLPVLAEGVETEAQLAFLAAEGCAEVQGYLIGRPQPIEYYRQVIDGEGAARPIAIAS